MAMPTHELITNKNGTASLREIASGEVMHSVVGPREEALLLYVEQSSLGERLVKQGDGELGLFDVGLGAGTNALASLQCHRSLAQRGASLRKLKIFSFENDPSGFRMAYENRAVFPFFEGFETAVEKLLGQRHWISEDGLIEWSLQVGDFREHAPKCPAPELVFFDFYSPQAVPHLWSASIFEFMKKIATTTPPPRAGTTLYTYSSSTRVRVALLLAGFYVGYGRNTGAKLETTAASTRLDQLARPLDERWLDRLQRSHAAVPYGMDESMKQEVMAQVRAHPQFRK